MADEAPIPQPPPEIPQITATVEPPAVNGLPAQTEPQRDVLMSDAPVEQPAVCLSLSLDTLSF